MLYRSNIDNDDDDNDNDDDSVSRGSSMLHEKTWAGGPEIVTTSNRLQRPIHVNDLDDDDDDDDDDNDDDDDDSIHVSIQYTTTTIYSLPEC